MGKIDQSGPNLVKLDQNELYWTELDRIDWSTPKEPNLTEMDWTEPNWTELDQIIGHITIFFFWFFLLILWSY